jgi:hypothetical protein
MAPFSQHGYVIVTKKHNFTINGEEVYSGSQVRNMYGSADDASKMKIIQQLYPKSKQQQMIKKLLDKYLASPQSPAVMKTKTTAMSKLKNKALAEQISRIRPLIKEASPEMKLKFMRLMKTAISETKINELSPQTLASYKKKAGADATASDKAGDFKRGDKRMSGIMKATRKEFDNDAKGVAEARTNPEQNVKAESGMKELEAVANTIADPQNWAISMTAEPKLGINPQVGISEDTPKGIYFYPLDYTLGMIKSKKPLPWGDNMPYIQLFQYDRSGEMTKETQVDTNKLKQAVGKYCSEEIMQQAIDEPEYDGTPYWFIYDCLSRLGESDETNIVRWNKVLRDLGFTSVFDPGHGWIAYNEPTQGVVLDPRIIKDHKTISNKKSSGVITPALIEQTLFDNLDVELAGSRAWQAWDPDGSKLRQHCKEWAKSPDFKPWLGKDASALWDETQKLVGLIGYYRRTVGREINNQAFAWYREQQVQKTESVTEAFDQPYKLKWEKSGTDITATTKLDDGGHLGIVFQKGYNQDKEEAWSVEFYRNNSQEVTGEGDAQRVFATVLTSIQSFIKKYKPNKVMFAASKEADDGQNSQSRARLYDSLVQRYAKSWGFRAFRAETGNKVFYELTRRDPVAETLDDPWGDQGNFAGDKPVNIGGDTVKRLEVGDIVLYLGQKAKILAQSKPAGKYSRIEITKGMGGVTQDVLTSDLKRTGGSVTEGSSLSVEQLAHISDKALDDAYHYGRSTPGANFGWLANLQSAKAAKRLIDAGETDIEKISDAIHSGWNVTAAADYKGQLQLDTPTPDEKKLKRAKLAQQSYSQLPEEEKEKDRVVARAMLAAMGKTNVSESVDYLEEK